MKTIGTILLVASAAIGGARFGYVAGHFDGRHTVSQTDAYMRGVVDTQKQWRAMAVRSGAAFWVRNPLTKDGTPNLIEWIPRQTQHAEAESILAGQF